MIVYQNTNCQLRQELNKKVKISYEGKR